MVLAAAIAAGSLGLAGGRAGALEFAASGDVPGRASSPAGASGSVAPGVQTGNDTVTMLSQSAWVETSGVYRFELQVGAKAAATEQLVVLGHSRLTNRTFFDDALLGHYDTGVAYAPTPIPLSSLTPDPDGGVDVEIPVNVNSTGHGLPEFYAQGGSGVFPIEISLADGSGTPIGQPLTTFLVYAAGSQAVTQYPPLSVAVVLPVHAAPAVDHSGSLAPVSDIASSALAAIASTLTSYSNVPVSLSVTPETLDALALGSATDRATQGELSDLVRGGPDEVLPSTYVDVSATNMVASGLPDELGRQIRAGSTALAGGLGVSAPSDTWVVNGPLDPSTLGVLAANGARHLVVPADELSALPAGLPGEDQGLTFANPSELAEPTATLPVYGADGLLTSDFDNSGGPVLAASQLLAEMAMIQLETPGLVRGVAVLPPPGWNVDTTFIRTLLAGLVGDPLLKAVTVSHLFSSVASAPVSRNLVNPVPPPASPPTSAGATSSSTAAPPTTATATTIPSSPFSSTDVASIRAARTKVDEVAGILGPDSTKDNALVATFGRQLLTAESVDLGESQRRSLIGSVRAQSAHILGEIALPNASITLTSTKGQLPLTILASPTLHARVQLRLSSRGLIFRAFTPGNGSCQVPAGQPTSLTCSLALTAQNTTIKIPVETRSSGVFPLNVTLLTADGRTPILIDKDTVRSTAVSGVGIILIVLAVLSLAVWWARDLHHGRRARRLVPAPADDTAVEDTADDGSQRPPVPAESPVGGAAPARSSAPSPGRGAHGPAADRAQSGRRPPATDRPPPVRRAPTADRPPRPHRPPPRGHRPPHPPP